MNHSFHRPLNCMNRIVGYQLKDAAIKIQQDRQDVMQSNLYRLYLYIHYIYKTTLDPIAFHFTNPNYAFGTTWEWRNYERIFILGWIITLIYKIIGAIIISITCFTYISANMSKNASISWPFKHIINSVCRVWLERTGLISLVQEPLGSDQDGIFSFEWTNPPGTFLTHKHTQRGDTAAASGSESCTVSDENN